MRLRCRLGRHCWVYRIDPLDAPPSRGAWLSKRCLYCWKTETTTFPAEGVMVYRAPR